MQVQVSWLTMRVRAFRKSSAARHKAIAALVSCGVAPLLIVTYLPMTASSNSPEVAGYIQPYFASQSQDQPDLSKMGSDELANYVFSHHGCSNCHTLGKAGKLGFTPRGKEASNNFEGCISLLTAMNVIAQTKPENRTAKEKEQTARFIEFGCTTCHQITPGKLGLTSYGVKLKSLHMACTDVVKVLAK